MRATKYVREDGWRDRRQAATRLARFLARIREAARRARYDPPLCVLRPTAPSGSTRGRFARRCFLTEVEESNSTHSLSSKLQNGGRHMPWRAVHSGAPVMRRAPVHTAQPRRRGGAQAPPPATRRASLSNLCKVPGVYWNSPENRLLYTYGKKEKCVTSESRRKFHVHIFQNRTN